MRQSDRLPDLERWNMPHRSVDMRDWEVAVNMARNIYRPDRSRLMDLYDSLVKDAHLGSVMETRVLRVQRSKFKLVDASGKSKPELSTFLETQWFEDALRYITEAEFYGHTLIELGELRKPGDLRNVNRIDPRNVLPYHGLVVRRQGEEVGYQYREAPLNNYFIEVGKRDDLGLLERVAPVAIIKKYALGSWSAFVGAYGIPARWVKSGARDARRIKQLEEVMQNMLSSAYAVIQGDEEFGIAPTPQGDPHKVFDDLISRMNSEISKRVLGQDGTTDNKDASGTFGSLKVLQGVAEDRHQSDKTAVMYVINEELLPRLVAMGYPFKGLRFQWDELRDMAPMELVDAVSKLGVVFDIDPKHVEERTGIKILGARRMPGEIGPGGGDPADPNKPADPAVSPEGLNIQDTAMNGAQVASLLELMAKVSTGEIPAAVARPLIRVAFPKVPEERIDQMLEGMKQADPPPTDPPSKGTGKQSGKKKAETEEGGEEEDDEDGDGITAQWPRANLGSCGVCGGRKHVVALSVPPVDTSAVESLLRSAWTGKSFDPAYYNAIAAIYGQALDGAFNTSGASIAYDAPDHAARALMDANLFRFAGMKSMAATLELNGMAKADGTFADFKRRVDESGVLPRYNVTELRTEYTNVAASGIQAQRYHGMMRDADVLPFGEYVTIGDGAVRPAHRDLNTKKWPLDHEVWKVIWPPNGWNCRCTVLPSEIGPAKAAADEQWKQVQGDMSQELLRMKRDGFNGNRGISGVVFDLNKSYVKQLSDKAGRQLKQNPAEAYGRTDMSFRDIMSRPLPKLSVTPRTNSEVDAWHAANANSDGYVVMPDWKGRPWTLDKATLDTHTDPSVEKYKDRAGYLDSIKDILANPDEVWSNQAGGRATRFYYLKYYEGKALTVRAELPPAATRGERLKVTSWYEAKPTNKNNAEPESRNGLMIKGMPASN